MLMNFNNLVNHNRIIELEASCLSRLPISFSSSTPSEQKIIFLISFQSFLTNFKHQTKIPAGTGEAGVNTHVPVG